MYFTKVELHNFGIYKGTHEMCLTDQIGNRNITLVGGLNGRGKTTFHDSILIALYGKQALKYIQEKARSYDKLLLDHINKHATDEETYVAVSLCLDDGTVLRVKRSWTARGKKVEQQTIVEKDGVVDKYLGESWSYYIEEILPFGIARFFFFNNEKITQLADDTSFEQIKSSIKSAIGVSTIEKAIEHTDEVIRRKKTALAAFEHSEENVGYQEIEKQIADIEVGHRNLLQPLHHKAVALVDQREAVIGIGDGHRVDLVRGQGKQCVLLHLRRRARLLLFFPRPKSNHQKDHHPCQNQHNEKAEHKGCCLFLH